MIRLSIAGLLSLHLAAFVPAIASAANVTETTASHSVMMGDVPDVWPHSISIFVAPGVDVAMSGTLIEALKQHGVLLQRLDISTLSDAEGAMARGLPSDPRAAAQEMARRLNAGVLDENSVRLGWYAVVLARQMRVGKLPAVVFDSNRIVYGVYNLDAALNEYRKYRAKADQR